MKIKLAIVVLTLVAAAAFITGPAAAVTAEVVQGKCVKYEPDKQLVTIEEYDTNFSKEAPYGKPTGIVFEGDVKTAKVGIKPEPGDILRIAFVLDGGTKRVLKIMNVSKQDLRKK
jgi:hypothetical protein